MRLSFICPLCKGSLVLLSEAYECRMCNHRFPIVLDIPDFRVFRDPYISIEDDYRKGRALHAMFDSVDFPRIVAQYWEMTPGVPAELVREYVRGVVNSRGRAMNTWATIQTWRIGGGGNLLDVGCGAGGLVAVAAQDVALAVGLDIAFRWLVIAKKRLIETGLYNVALVCACAEHLPFADGTFDTVAGEDVIDHAREPSALVRESSRVLRSDGVFFLSTPNRFSLGPDPHVWVWGVGFIPPRLRDRYIRWRRGVPYGPIHPVSYFELRRYLHKQFPQCQISLPSLGLSRAGTLRTWQRLLLQLYEKIRNIPVLRHILLLVGPGLQVVCRRQPR